MDNQAGRLPACPPSLSVLARCLSADSVRPTLLRAVMRPLPPSSTGLDRIPFQKMLVVRSLRPDRMTNALSSFIRGALPNGNAYADCDSTLSAIEVLDQSLGDSTPSTPIYFILSPGANVVGILDKLADKYK